MYLVQDIVVGDLRCFIESLHLLILGILISILQMKLRLPVLSNLPKVKSLSSGRLEFKFKLPKTKTIFLKLWALFHRVNILIIHSG